MVCDLIQAKAEDALFVSRFLNDHVADCVRQYPQRFVGLGTVPAQVRVVYADCDLC